MTGIQYLDLPGLWQTGSNIIGQQQRNNLLALQAEMEQQKLALSKAQAEARQRIISDPKLTDEARAAITLAPDQYFSAWAESQFPKGKAPFAVPENSSVYDPITQTWSQGPRVPKFGTAPLPGQPPGANLQTVAPQSVPAPNGITAETLPPLPGPDEPGLGGDTLPLPKPQVALTEPPAAVGPRKQPKPLGPVPDALRPLVDAHARRTGLPPDVVGRQMMLESGGRVNAVGPVTASGARAQGLMQIMDATAADPGFGVRPKQDNSPEEQVRFATDYLAALRDHYAKMGFSPDDALKLALGGYVWGPRKVDTWLRTTKGDLSRVPPEVRSYVQRIFGPGGQSTPAPQTAPQTALAPEAESVVRNVLRPDAAPAPTATPPTGLPAGADGFAYDLKTGAYVKGSRDGYGVVVDAQGNPVGEAPIPNARQKASRAATAEELRAHNLPPGTAARIDENGELTVLQKAGEGGSNLFGNTAEGRAMQVLVDAKLISEPDAARWLAGKMASGQNNRLDFVPPGGAPVTLREGDLTPQDKEAIRESDDSIATLDSAVKGLKQALSLNDKAFSGAFGGLLAWGDRNLLPGEWGGEDTTVFRNSVETLGLQLLKPTFGGNPTEGERKAAMDLVAGVDKSPAERKRLLEKGIEAAEARLEREKARAAGLRGGTYYKEGLPPLPPAPSRTDYVYDPATGKVVPK